MLLKNQPTCHQLCDSFYSVARPITAQSICEYIIFDRFLSQLRTTQNSPFTVLTVLSLEKLRSFTLIGFQGDLGRDTNQWAAHSLTLAGQSSAAVLAANLQDISHLLPSAP